MTHVTHWLAAWPVFGMAVRDGERRGPSVFLRMVEQSIIGIVTGLLSAAGVVTVAAMMMWRNDAVQDTEITMLRGQVTEVKSEIRDAQSDRKELRKTISEMNSLLHDIDGTLKERNNHFRERNHEAK